MHPTSLLHLSHYHYCHDNDHCCGAATMADADAVASAALDKWAFCSTHLLLSLPPTNDENKLGLPLLVLLLLLYDSAVNGEVGNGFVNLNSLSTSSNHCVSGKSNNLALDDALPPMYSLTGMHIWGVLIGLIGLSSHLMSAILLRQQWSWLKPIICQRRHKIIMPMKNVLWVVVSIKQQRISKQLVLYIS